MRVTVGKHVSVSVSVTVIDAEALEAFGFIILIEVAPKATEIYQLHYDPTLFSIVTRYLISLSQKVLTAV